MCLNVFVGVVMCHSRMCNNVYAIHVYVAFLVFIYIFEMWVCLVSTDSVCEVFRRVYA